MNERVKTFLKQKEAETGIAIDTENTASADTENTIPANVRDRLLLRAGLYDKVYSEEKSRTNEYPYYDHTVGKYYKEVPIEVTDDELRAIQKAQDASKKDQLISKYNSPIGFFGNFVGSVNEDVNSSQTSFGSTLAQRANGNASDYQRINYITGMGTAGSLKNAYLFLFVLLPFFAAAHSI